MKALFDRSGQPYQSCVYALILAGLISTQAQANCDIAELGDQMSPAEFKQAGLDKLSEDELNALNRWLREKMDCSAPAAAAVATPATPAEPEQDQRGFERDFSDIQPIETRIVGEFKGWTGQSRFTMENGQVWKQVRGGSYRTKSVTNPKVTITPEFMGSWALRVEDVGRVIRVKRIK